MHLDFERINSALSRLARARGKSHRLNQFTLILFGLGLTAFPMITVNAESNEVYFDDTHRILRSGIDIEVVSGDFGYDEYQRIPYVFFFSEPADGEALALDTRNASFIVANSQNANPVEGYECDEGSLTTNKYPIKLYNDDMVYFVGGIVNGEINQTADWDYIYNTAQGNSCNSAVILFRESPDSIVDGVRITSAWDGIRPSQNTTNLTIKNSWFSNIRDDVVENDEHEAMVFEDNLVDGTFQGISIRGTSASSQSNNVVEIYGSVIKIREYLYKGNQYYGALFKNESSSPTSIIENTVVAVDYEGGRTWSSNWPRVWSKIDSCSNNLFLWLSDEPIQSRVDPGSIPSCFTIITGAAAQTIWNEAKQNWIDCHPKVARTPSDPGSNPAQCVANTFGGYSR